MAAQYSTAGLTIPNSLKSGLEEFERKLLRQLTVMTHAQTLAHVGAITPEQLMTLRSQIFSPDEENITVAEATVDSLLTKWWQEYEKSKSGT